MGFGVWVGCVEFVVKILPVQVMKKCIMETPTEFLLIPRRDAEYAEKTFCDPGASAGNLSRPDRTTNRILPETGRRNRR